MRYDTASSAMLKGAAPGPAAGPADHAADVLVIGGGLVGGMLACALGQAGLSVIVVDRDHPANLTRPSLDGRGTAISLSSKRLLDGIGIWADVEAEAGAIREIRVSDQQSLLFLHYDHADVGDEPLGWIVENPVTRRALQARIRALPEVTVLAPASVARLDRDADGVRAVLADGRRLAARLAVAADGRGSPTRSAAGIGLTRWDYHQVGIVCTVEHEHPHDNVAQEHFLKAGPFAILPMAHPRRSSIVWTERERLAPTIMALPDDEFLAELESRFGDFRGQLRVVGPRFAYPLTLQFANTYVGRRLALAGDAAHGMHPIAGQGLNMGIRDVGALAQVVVDANRLGLDVGDATVLAAYERWRRFDNTAMLLLTDVLNRLFSNDIGPVQLVRDIGLGIVNRLPPVKAFFMRHAMGTVGDLPRLLRGETL